MEAVAACMTASRRACTRPTTPTTWTVAGLLHDFDYETTSHRGRAPVRRESSISVPVETRGRGSVLHAILGHVLNTSGVDRDTPMAKHLFACDELAGFIVACAKVRPNGIGDLKSKSVKKKLKDKKFAAAVSRSDIELGIQELGVDQTEHIDRCIDAIRSAADRVGC